MRQSWMILCAALIAGGLSGCGNSGPRYVPVSGVVTLDGKPFGDGVVVFHPKSTSTNPNPGRTSAGETDSKGHFVLKTDDLKNGAVLGTHVVRISTRGPVMQFDPATGSPDTAPANVKRDLIPAEWNTMSEKEFEVPPKGTDKANFDIVTKKK
jgi:predicted small lipoprotein YifL